MKKTTSWIRRRPRSSGHRGTFLALLSRLSIHLLTLMLSSTGMVTAATGGEVLQVGPARSLKTIGEAARIARNGTTVEVDAGEYSGDVAVWTQDDFLIRAVGGRVRLRAMGVAAEGKAIWVIRGGRITVEGFDFEGARVADGNGAGIRFEAGSLTVRDCRFLDNETGLLTGNDARAELTVEDSEFGRIHRARGHNHNLYAGAIGKLSVSGSYFHHGAEGHLLKSRAAVNHIFYNRLTDEAGGTASYELEFPNGGVALVVGNIVEQSKTTENPVMISYGVEGVRWPVNIFLLLHNTLVDNRPRGGEFLRVTRGNVIVRAVNNLLVGNVGKLDTAAPGEYRSNFNIGWNQFVRADADDYRLLVTSSVLGKAVNSVDSEGASISPKREYVHPRGTTILSQRAHHPGAVQRLGER